MSFGYRIPSSRSQAEQVAQWLYQLRQEEQRVRDRQALEPVLARQHFHVAMLKKIQKQEDGYLRVIAGGVLALAIVRTGDEAYAARQRIVAAGEIAEITECYGITCYPAQEESGDVLPGV